MSSYKRHWATLYNAWNSGDSLSYAPHGFGVETPYISVYKNLFWLHIDLAWTADGVLAKYHVHEYCFEVSHYY